MCVLKTGNLYPIYANAKSAPNALQISFDVRVRVYLSMAHLMNAILYFEL